MPYNTLVTSPLPLPMDRQIAWSEKIYEYDSGRRQSATPWVRPLYRYGFSMKNMNRVKQSSLHAFYNQQQGMMIPFLMKDPYDYKSNYALNSGTAIAANSGFQFANNSGWAYLPDSGTLKLISTLSGALVSSTHFVASLDNGWITLKIGKAAADTITTSAEYFRKVAFSSFAEQSFLWDEFNGSFSVKELLP